MTEIANPRVTDQVVHLGCLAADEVVFLNMNATSMTGAEKTRAIVRRTLEALEANGVIYIVPDENHPFFFKPFPPYGDTDTGMLMQFKDPDWKGEV